MHVGITVTLLTAGIKDRSARSKRGVKSVLLYMRPMCAVRIETNKMVHIHRLSGVEPVRKQPAPPTGRALV